MPTGAERHVIGTTTGLVVGLVGIVLFFAVAIYPTAHARTRQEPYQSTEMVSKEQYLSTLDCSNIPRETMLSPLEDSTRFVLNVTCSQWDVRVRITGAHSPIIYDRSDMIHRGNVTGTDSRFYVEVSSNFPVSGTIKVYRIYQVSTPVTKYRTVQYSEMLPWWMP